MTMASRLDRWPELLREIARSLGEDAALKLVAKRGGQRIYIPKADRSSQLRDELGPDLFTFLTGWRNPGEHLDIPNFGARLADERRRFVLQHDELSANDLASRLGITKRRVEMIRSDARTANDPRQLFLFD